jgi:hypothetical protein
VKSSGFKPLRTGNLKVSLLRDLAKGRGQEGKDIIKGFSPVIGSRPEHIEIMLKFPKVLFSER